MSEKILEQVFYVCKYCSSVFENYAMAEIHIGECLNNYDDVHTCTTCKHCAINLVSPADKDNGYKSLRLQGITGVKAFLSCGNNVYNGKLTEDKILKVDKGCYEPMAEGEQFIVIHTDSYKRYKELIDRADKEQKEIDEEIEDYWNYVRELDEQGYSKEEIQEILSEKYADEEIN
jgi:uncharacterized protein (UPF0335 family)